ncbi:MAG TPA: acyl-CoA dehydrogenase family protein, partial [Paenirhodobacter sp.]
MWRYARRPATMRPAAMDVTKGGAYQFCGAASLPGPGGCLCAQAEGQIMPSTCAIILGRARDLVPTLAGRAAEYDRTAEFPRQDFADMHAAGLLSLTISAAHGGPDGGLYEAVQATNIVAKGDPSVALAYSMHLWQTYRISRRPEWPAPLVTRILRANAAGVALINAAQVEPGTGAPSHGGLPQTIAHAEGTHWRLTGRKI